MARNVEQRRRERTEEIIAAAWGLAREVGLHSVTLRALAREVGIRQPSLYEYFDSKLEIYDAMFADGNRQLLQRLDGLALPADPRQALKMVLRAFVDFALEDEPRCELLFERHIPGFDPSPVSYALAHQALDCVVAAMEAAGVTDPGDIDCLVAVTAGLMQAQRTNEPGGTRWVRHLDRMIDLVLDNPRTRSTP